MPRRSSCTALCLALLLFHAVSLGDEPAVDSLEGHDRLQEMKKQAKAYAASLTLNVPARLSLHEDPLLRFNNPVSGVPDGIVAMWKDGNRPAVLAQVFQTKEGLWIHECQSLARAGLIFELDKVAKWSPEASADDFRKLEEGPPAAETAARRLAQMKRIASEFTASDDFKVRASDKETTRHALRMLPTPVYRYSDEAAAVSDGAVFAFVHGTDPELFLVLEHRSDDASGWYYALVPMTCWAVEAKRHDKTLWSVSERLGKSKPTDAYHVWIYRPEQRRP